MSKNTEFTATVTTVDRLQNSRNGNPRYRVYFDIGGPLNTEPDAGFAYNVVPFRLEGRLCRVTVGGHGTIVGIETVERRVI